MGGRSERSSKTSDGARPADLVSRRSDGVRLAAE
jgi:hypothetical protein